MKYNYPYLKDIQFLREVDELHNKTQLVTITVLTMDEEPIQEIQGKVVSGSINIDGSSTVRRTCNLTLIADKDIYDITNIENLIALNKKAEVKIGIKNTTNKYTEYEWLWFPQGIYVMISSSISNSLSGMSISLQLKDKMCLLNGEVGGVITSATNFSEIITYQGGSIAREGLKSTYIINSDSNSISNSTVNVVNPSEIRAASAEAGKSELVADVVKKNAPVEKILQPTLYRIIQEAVNHFGGEQLSKIIISDLDNRVKQLMMWTGQQPLYRFDCTTETLQTVSTYTLDANWAKNQVGDNWQTYFSRYSYEYGDNVGYIMTDFVYPGELTGNAGDTVCTILDKIKSLLGNFEYFYDIEGNFVFQEIKNYLNTTQAKTVLMELAEYNGQAIPAEKTQDSSYLIDLTKGKSVYQFEDSKIISSYNVTPQWNLIKNDFIIWGMRKEADGRTWPIRYHLAIDKKPEVGNIYYCVEYTDATVDESIDLKKYAIPKIVDNPSELPRPGLDAVFYRCEHDKDGNVTPQSLFMLWDNVEKEYFTVTLDYKCIKTKNWQTELYLSGIQAVPFGSESNYYYAELANEWPKLFELEATSEKHGSDIVYKDVLKKNLNGVSLDFFLDFIDSGAEVSKFSVNNIGRRQKIEVNEKVNCLFPPDYPDIVLIEAGQKDTEERRKECVSQGQAYSQVVSSIFASLSTGLNYTSAYDIVRDYLYQYTGYNESISLQTLPILYLEPNTRITVKDSESGIYGDYMIKSMSIPFDIGGMMNISCTKALERI